MGHSYSVLYEDDTCLFEDEIEHTRIGELTRRDPALARNSPLIVFEATGITPDRRKVLSVTTFLTVC